ncbi:eCIS core domain-containing protein [Streptomyces gardneri]|uniref:eCIS core domain-containing protein n=1 Tax=Streptomyces gardneri TaxID=66892 RepID=UPI0035E05125
MAREANRSPDSEYQQTAARAPLPASEALHIQRTAGNGVLVQLLRQAAHPWAQEQHQHTAGCGHQQQPAVQRSAVHDVLRASGRPLDDATRTDMESRLDADFSDVRVHDDSAARASAAEVGARAYTSGNHVVIGQGGADKHTLAHELTHVIQQRQGPVDGTDNGSGLKVSDPSDRYERDAEANATRVMSGPTPTTVSRAAAPERDQQATSTSDRAVQRMTYFTPGEPALGHPGFTVFLNATLNGVDIGSWTSANDFGQVTQDHAEDQMIDAIDTAIGFMAINPAIAAAGAGTPILNALTGHLNALEQAGIDVHQNQIAHHLHINLSASPCSTTFGTSTKIQGEGCAERLTRLAQGRFGQNGNHRFRITIRAHHLYQPQHLQNAAQVSQQVNQQLGANGITVMIG